MTPWQAWRGSARRQAPPAQRGATRRSESQLTQHTAPRCGAPTCVYSHRIGQPAADSVTKHFRTPPNSHNSLFLFSYDDCLLSTPKCVKFTKYFVVTKVPVHLPTIYLRPPKYYSLCHLSSPALPRKNITHDWLSSCKMQNNASLVVAKFFSNFIFSF